MTYPFGKAFTRWYFPLVDNQSPTGVLTSQTPSIYIFSTQPDRTTAAAGTGAVQTVSSWTWNTSVNGWSYTVAAIDDPEPTGATSLRTYWEAVNYRLESGEQIQTDVRAFFVQRATGHSHSVGVTDAVLKEYYPQLDACSNPTQREQLIALAVEDVKARLKNKGFEWAMIHRIDRLNIAIAYKTLYMIMLIQIQQGNDKYAIKYAEFKAIFDSTIESLVLEYDSNGDGLPDTNVKAASGPVRIVR
ncbi:MAG: hypothetical protein E6R03_09680 [Hyphomicrobiaceae bacterium]|nr:MAG: hypothetical protein E6R03_09680 [Hyphomicrobiaceae bacterium]